MDTHGSVDASFASETTFCDESTTLLSSMHRGRELLCCCALVVRGSERKRTLHSVGVLVTHEVTKSITEDSVHTSRVWESLALVVHPVHLDPEEETDTE